MNYVKAKTYDVANGPGVRVTVFAAGCPHEPKCPNCFNPETWDFCSGEPFSDEVIDALVAEASKPYISGITLLGGEPMALKNQEGFMPLVKQFKEANPDKTVWCFTGFLWSDVMDMYERCEVTKELLPMIDVMVDGKFVEALKDPRLYFKGSSNQRTILVKETLADKDGKLHLIER